MKLLKLNSKAFDRVDIQKINGTVQSGRLLMKLTGGGRDVPPF
jgi:hypothetical protein